jgi:non-specific serine/threonine protein kinase/serine/threonine-protein kinase
VAIALVGGTVATAWQAREARAAQARAERRFNDVRALAHAVLFDYHDAIKDLPGSTPIRERLVRDALRYLDTLALEAQGDRSLQRELAAAYERVGDVQGGTITANLGDTRGAIESYGKAARVLDALLSSDSTDAASRRELAGVLVDMGDLTFDTGDVPGGLTLARQAETVIAPLGSGPLDRDLRLELGKVDDLLGVLLLETGDARAAVARHQVAITRLETAPSSERQEAPVRRALSIAYQHSGDALAQIGGSEAALDPYEKARTIRADLVAEFPDNDNYRHLLGSIEFWIGVALADLGRDREALVRFRAGLSRDSVEAAHDPKNAANRAALAFSLARVGDMLIKLNQPGEALATYRQSLAIRVAELRADSTNLFKRIQLVEGQAGVCRATAALAPARADPECEGAARLMRETVLDSANAGYRGYLAGQYSDLAQVYDSLVARSTPGERTPRARAALDLYRRSANIWLDLERRGLVNPTDTARVTAARLAVARAAAAVAP